MTVIVDYRAGNLTSVKLAFAALGEPVEVTNDPAKVRAASRVVFPGVGAARSAMGNLRDLGLVDAVKEAAGLFEGRGGNIRTMEIERHDEYMSYVLGLSHAVNIAFFTVLERSGISFGDMQSVASTTFRKIMDTNTSVALEDPLLYYEIQHLNDNRDDIWRMFSKAVKDLREASLSDDPSEFVELMRKGRNYFTE
jgi:chorismate mutase/prephenate dehydrogenase